MSDDLKPCPFCKGEAAKIPDDNHSTGWEVGCFSGKCDVEPHVWAVYLETAVMQWNTRADADRIEQLERENARLDAGWGDANLRALDAGLKLAKGVECLQWIMNHRGECFIPEPWDDMANDVLAELEGGGMTAPNRIYASLPSDDPEWSSGAGEWDISGGWAVDSITEYVRVDLFAKAVSLALEECPFGYGTGGYNDWWYDRRTVLAELKGEPLGAEFEAVWDANKERLYQE